MGVLKLAQALWPHQANTHTHAQNETAACFRCSSLSTLDTGSGREIPAYVMVFFSHHPSTDILFGNLCGRAEPRF